MGIFNRLGRQIEQFKQNAKDAAEETAEYQCQDCGSLLHTEYDECPDCGAREVSPLQRSE